MNVIATQVGFYVKLRKPGDEFDVPERAFSAKWMKRVEESKAEAPAEVPAAPVVEPVEAPAVEPVVKKRRGRRPKAVSE